MCIVYETTLIIHTTSMYENISLVQCLKALSSKKMSFFCNFYVATPIYVVNSLLSCEQMLCHTYDTYGPPCCHLIMIQRAHGKISCATACLLSKRPVCVLESFPCHTGSGKLHVPDRVHTVR